jgi:hypothetical protein
MSRRIDIQPEYGYDGLDKLTTGRRTDIRTVVSIQRPADAYGEPSYRYPERRTDIQAVISIFKPP